MKQLLFPETAQFQNIDTIQQYKITALLILSLTVGCYILFFGAYRIFGGRYIVGASEITLGCFFLVSFILLRKDIQHYQVIARSFFVIAYVLMVILTLYIPDERTHILWVPAILVLIFFLLDYRGGILFLVSYILFVLYLAVAGYDYTVTEYITWIVSLVATSLVMFYYEKIKQIETKFLQESNRILHKKVDQKTALLSEQNSLLKTQQTELEALNQNLKSRIQKELKKREKQEKILLQQCRMGSMGEILDTISHQWRQPLMHINAILINLDAEMEKKESSLPYMKQKMAAVATQTQQMSQIIEAYRSLFDTHKKETVFEMQDIIEKALSFCAPSSRQITIFKRIQCETSYKGYFNEILQVLMVLLSYTTERLARYEKHPKNLHITLVSEKDTMILSLSDNAGCIDNDAILSLFDPYPSGSGQEESSTLGLYIAKIIVEKNTRGSLKVTQDNQGLRFILQLRRHHAEHT